jgi:integrase
MSPIELIVNANGRRTKFCISNKATEDIWDSKRGLIDISKVSRSKEFRKLKSFYESLNDQIQQKISEFRLFMMEQERFGTDVSVDIIRSFFNVGRNISFYTFWDEQIEMMRPKLKPSTILSYQDTKKILMKFRPRLDFGDFSIDTVKKFDNYLITERANSDGGRFNRHKNLKSMLKLAVMNKHLKDNPYTHFKIRPAKGNREFLTFDEVKSLKAFCLPEDHRNLQGVFDMFLFACYTGLRYSDIQNLKWKNVRLDEGKIEIDMVKTTSNLKQMLVSDAIDILRNLRQIRNPEHFVFKRITNQAINRSLKVIMREAKVNKPITFHCARHTFATILIEAGQSIYNVKGLLGHQNVENTQIYAKLLQKGLDGSMAELNKLLVA